MLPLILPSSDRQSLRRTLRARRRALSVFARKKAARELAHRLAALPALKTAQHIALYWPVDGEIDTRTLLRHARMTRRKFYLPVLRKFPANTLAFARWHAGRALHPNRLGIPEPAGRVTFSARHMDVILLPLTGFDARGNRLGMGGGFYDRTLAFRKHGHAHKPVLIGVAHACQQVDRLESAVWDIPLNQVATDKHVFR
ncbi:MAG: 5-formyltetrahydrofolate cyclo-ligase [bacterium]|nr:5-formyltetrahydrofolate cyclo-ligase [bacterium]